MSESVNETVTMFALRKKGSNAPHLAASSWGCFAEPLLEKAKESEDLEVVRVTVELANQEPYSPTPADEADYWKKAAFWMAEVHAANASAIAGLKSSTKSKRRITRSIMEACASILRGEWPNSSRPPYTTDFERIITRCERTVKAFSLPNSPFEQTQEHEEQDQTDTGSSGADQEIGETSSGEETAQSS